MHGIPYVAPFIVLHNNVVDFNHSILLGRPWLKDAKIAHDWGNNMVTIKGNKTIKTIVVAKIWVVMLSNLKYFCVLIFRMAHQIFLILNLSYFL
jgi:hypothetical protein